MKFPEVKREILDSVLHGIETSEGRQKDWEALTKENPVIAEIVHSYMVKVKERPDLAANITLLCGMMVYRLLKSQFEADRLNEIYNV